ncbi:MAG TPA: sigma-54-dependent Fis family transcriptional regulator [Clostridiales bacterium UBA9856]|nr:sigma-54-dependent Fis family transcriptional regulator [Clostridiales bacterium UBA9856]HPZ59615.1 sigma 54-interacting transcriptional regulator [Bacillota bacterium]
MKRWLRVTMHGFDSTYNDRLREAWGKFINNEPYDYSFIRPEIYESWVRSRSYLVDPYNSKTALLPPDDLQKRMEDNKFLIEITRPYMEKLYSIVKGSGFYLLLADKDGYILDLIGDQDIIERGRSYSKLVVGANRSEQYAGTNAIGTGLFLKKPIQMWGEEHYVKPHKGYSCSSAPIFDTEGRLLGCLNITGRAHAIHLHTLGMVISAVDGISNQLRLMTAYMELEKVSNQRNRIIETMASGLVLLNSEYEIIQVNSKFLTMLNLRNRSVIGKSLFEFIRFDESDADNTSLLDNEVYNKEIDVYPVDSSAPPMKFNMSLNFLYDSHGLQEGMVLRFNETKRINRLVNRISGFKPNYTFDSIIGSSNTTKKMIYECKRAASSSSNILILGESGTGKELVAQAIHSASKYSTGPFVAINCGALPKGLVESELFGYERGAFTGANKDGHPGKFELADGGTLFLDEIGEMPLDVQVTLLRVLETREVVRIGGKYPKPIDVRIIAATNRDLREAVKDKTFRDDLYYRLNVLSIRIPPLRERGDDILELTDYFIKGFSSSKGITYSVDPRVYDILTRYTWPGNIRELENTIERAVNITDNNMILPEHLPTHILQSTGISDIKKETVVERESVPSVLNLESAEYNLVVSSLEKCQGNVKKAAEMLGISRRTMYRKMQKYNIDYNTFR